MSHCCPKSCIPRPSEWNLPLHCLQGPEWSKPWLPLQPHVWSPFSLPPSTLPPWPLNTRQAFALEALHMLPLWPKSCSPGIPMSLSSLPSGLYSNVTSCKRVSLTILLNTIAPFLFSIPLPVLFFFTVFITMLNICLFVYFPAMRPKVHTSRDTVCFVYYCYPST